MHNLNRQPEMLLIADRYEIHGDPIGQGGMGVVYKAYDRSTRRYVALKTISGGMNNLALELFQKEWSVLARLSHPNIVDILETGEFQDRGERKPFFVMPLLPGQTLDELIKQASQRLTVERTVEIMSQTCRGLQAAHEQGIIHRDLKPSNIFVLNDDSVKIIDFGVVHLTGMNTMTGMKGTLQYLAPELLDRKAPSIPSDIYALAVVCYEALTRRKPFVRSNDDETVEAIRCYIPPPISDINSSVNDLLSRTVNKAMAKQPWHRFSSAREFSDVLKKALRGEPIEYFDPTKIQPRIERVKKAQGEGDYQFAKEMLAELEAEGHIDLQISMLRMQLDQAIKLKTIRQLLDSARTRIEEEEFPLALQKIQEILEIEPEHMDALQLKAQIDEQRNEKQIDNWYRVVNQHMDNQLFSQARLGLEEILRISPADTKAHKLLGQIEQQEREATKIREEKEQLYQSALKCYQCGEVSTALDRLERLLEISRRTTRAEIPEKDAQYQSLYNQIRSEREAFRNGYAEARRLLEDKNFAKALAICSEFLGKNPADPMFQALKLEVEERDRQERSAAIASVERRVEAEADLDRKLDILKEASETYATEPHFKEALKAVRNRRDLLNSIVNKAKLYEKQSQFNEAIGQWEILRSIYAQYPGLEAEVQRLKVKRSEQSREEAKSRWVRQIDQYLEAGDFEKSQLLLREALAEFPADRELSSLEKLAANGLECRVEAEKHFAEAQQLCSKGNAPEAVAVFRKALELDPRNPTIRAAFLGTLLSQGRARLNEDWKEAQALIEEALQLDPNNPVAKSLIAQITDRERLALVDACVFEARELQAAGDARGALEKVRDGLARHPRETRLSQLESTLVNSLSSSSRDGRVSNPPPRLSGDDLHATALQGFSRLFKEETMVEADAASPSFGGAAAAPARQLEAQPSQASVAAATPATKPVPRPAFNVKPATAKLTALRSRRSAMLQPLWRSLSALLLSLWQSLSALSLGQWAAVLTIPVLSIAGAAVYYSAAARQPMAHLELRANVNGATFVVDGKPASSPLSLIPGIEHQVQAFHQGYESSTRKVTPTLDAPATLEFNLAPLPAQLRLSSDLTGSLSIGDQPAVSFQPGDIKIDSLPAGLFSLKISGATTEVVTLPLNAEPGKAVTLSSQLTATDSTVALASVLGSRARIYASQDVQGASSGQPLQAIPPEGVDIDLNGKDLTYSLSDGQSLTISPSEQPTLLLRVKNHATTTTAEAATPRARLGKAKAQVTFQSLPAGTEVHVDQGQVVLVPDSGAVLITVDAGKRKLFIRKSHYEDSRVFTKTFQPGEKLTLTDKDFPLSPLIGLQLNISPAGSVATIVSGDQSQAQGGRTGETLWLKPGKYTFQMDAPGHLSETRELELKTGEGAELAASLPPSAPAKTAPSSTPTSTPSDLWMEDATLWSNKGGWLLTKKEYGWLRSRTGIWDVTIQRPKKSYFKNDKKIDWTMDYRDNANKVMYWIEGENLHRMEYKNGPPGSEASVPLPKHPGDYSFTFEVTAQHIVVSENGTKLDEFSRKDPNVPPGKIGLHGELSVIVKQRK